MYLSSEIYIAFCLQLFPQFLRRLKAKSRCLSVIASDSNGGKVMCLYDTKANPCIFFDFFL